MVFFVSDCANLAGINPHFSLTAEDAENSEEKLKSQNSATSADSAVKNNESILPFLVLLLKFAAQGKRYLACQLRRSPLEIK
jgi:hypothetical protein